jgi:hypothetical protein
MSVIGGIGAMLMSGLLLWAGLEKARSLGATAATFRALGLGWHFPWFAAAITAMAEIGTALCLVLWPNALAVQAAVAVLAVAFAFAGALALWQRRIIRCSCFGSGSGGYLGKVQIAALPLWFVGAATLHLGLTAPPPLEVAACWFAMMGLTIALLRARVLLRAQHEAAGDRLSAQEMFAWLR